MASILGAIACSHTPTIGFRFYKNQGDNPVSAHISEAFEPSRNWLKEKRPDVAIFVCNDHVTSLFFDHYSGIALGVGKEFAVPDEGGDARASPAIFGHPWLAAVSGVSNRHVYAAMHGQSLAEFRKSRNAPGALNSGAGTDSPKQGWETPLPSTQGRAS